MEANNTTKVENVDRVIIGVVAAALAVFIGYEIYTFAKAISNTITNPFSNGAKENETAKKDSVNSLEIDKSYTTITEQQAQTIADNIYSDLNGWHIFQGSIEDGLDVELSQVKNQDDAWLVIQKFGIKKDTIFGISKTQGLTLPEYITYKFGDDYADHVKKYLDALYWTGTHTTDNFPDEITGYENSENTQYIDDNNNPFNIK